MWRFNADQKNLKSFRGPFDADMISFQRSYAKPNISGKINVTINAHAA